MSNAFDDDKERIRESVNIAELVGSYINLRRQGSALVGICPWHNDSKPSLNVTPSRQSWRCWVCNIGGDIFSFVMQVEGVDFPEAKRMLADRAGIELSKTSLVRSGNEREAPHKKSSLLKIVQWAEKRFHDMLLNGAEAESARAYLAERGFDSESVQRYRIGFSPRSWTWLHDLARQREISNESLIEAGLIGRSEQRGSHYDRFRGRLIFPIRDFQARPIAFGGRILPQWADDGAKYVNSPETPLFKKRSQLYGMSEVRDEITKTRAVTGMEGYTDVVMASQLGVKDAVAVLGTALGEGHIHFLQRFVDQVTLVLDGDAAGRNRANEVLNLFITQNLDLRVLTLPDGLDPCDFIAQHGVEEFDQMRKRAPDALEHKIQVELAGFDPLRDTHRAGVALDNLLTAIASAPRSFGTQQSKEMLILGRLARTFHLQESDIRTRLASIRKRGRTKQWVHEVVDDVPPPMKIPSNERELLEILLLGPGLIEVVAENVDRFHFKHAGCREVFQLMLDLHAEGLTLDFANVLDRLETIVGQSLLMDLDDEARKKAETTEASPAERWEKLYETNLDELSRLDDARKRKTLDTNLNDTEALDVLNKLLESKRARMRRPDTEDWD
ncbi:MAG: DNA primase [Pirellulaceae bacterium]